MAVTLLGANPMENKLIIQYLHPGSYTHSSLHRLSSFAQPPFIDISALQPLQIHFKGRGNLKLIECSETEMK